MLLMMQLLLMQTMKIAKQGAKEVFYLEGGLSSWIDNNMPLSGDK